ncbi:hypothetical protein [Nocardia fluminea]|uniref:hypothetical protein n=1 Tax=Nocardia fluminea TaxID=134984 RepID=UPI003D0B9BDA
MPDWVREPGVSANREKRAALGQFQPHGVLVSTGKVREQRRAVNEAALDTGRPLHRLAAPFTEVIAEEADHLLAAATREQYPQLVPFSAGPAACPGRDLVLFVTSTLLAQLLRNATFALRSAPDLRPDEPLPLTHNNFGLDFTVCAAAHDHRATADS